jgi:hypothetical protein
LQLPGRPSSHSFCTGGHCANRNAIVMLLKRTVLDLTAYKNYALPSCVPRIWSKAATTAGLPAAIAAMFRFERSMGTSWHWLCAYGWVCWCGCQVPMVYANRKKYLGDDGDNLRLDELGTDRIYGRNPEYVCCQRCPKICPNQAADVLVRIESSSNGRSRDCC